MSDAASYKAGYASWSFDMWVLRIGPDKDKDEIMKNKKFFVALYFVMAVIMLMVAVYSFYRRGVTSFDGWAFLFGMVLWIIGGIIISSRQQKQ